MNIRRFFLDRLVFPQTVIFDQPGLILSKSMRFYGHSGSSKRIMLHFEGIITEVHKQVMASLGDTKTKEIFYKFGKEVGWLNVLYGGKRSVPELLRKPALEYILRMLDASGMSFSKEFTLNDHEMTLKGDHVLICRLHGDGSFAAGMASSVISFITGSNIEAMATCDKCPGSCIIKASPEFPQVHVPDLKKLSRLVKPPPIKENSFGKNATYSDMMKFGNIKVGDDGKQSFFGETIYPGTDGFKELFHSYFKEEGQEKLFLSAVHDGSREVMSRIITKNPGLKGKKRFFCDTVSSLGIGIAEVAERKNGSQVILRYAPDLQGAKEYVSHQLGGFLSGIYGNTYTLKSIGQVGKAMRIEYKKK